MSKIIEGYYEKANVSPLLLKRKLEKLSKHSDITAELEYWITEKKYRDDGVVVEGYTAKSLAEISKYLDGEGVFMLLIELRENPKKALNKISDGFKVK